jgi:hypothetical protein
VGDARAGGGNDVFRESPSIQAEARASQRHPHRADDALRDRRGSGAPRERGRGRHGQPNQLLRLGVGRRREQREQRLFYREQRERDELEQRLLFYREQRQQQQQHGLEQRLLFFRERR